MLLLWVVVVGPALAISVVAVERVKYFKRRHHSP
jgi:hypothetical protein